MPSGQGTSVVVAHRWWVHSRPPVGPWCLAPRAQFPAAAGQERPAPQFPHCKVPSGSQEWATRLTWLASSGLGRPVGPPGWCMLAGSSLPDGSSNLRALALMSPGLTAGLFLRAHALPGPGRSSCLQPLGLPYTWSPLLSLGSGEVADTWNEIPWEKGIRSKFFHHHLPINAPPFLF